MMSSVDRLNADSYYVATAATPAEHAPLYGDVDCDTCVVGGGLAGLSAALELAQRGHSVVLLEAHTVGWGASGRNGGQALVGLACDMDVVRARVGAVAARRIWELSVEAVALIHARRTAFSIDCEWQPGYLHAAVSAAKARALSAWSASLARDYNFAMEMIDGADVRQWIASDRYVALAHDALSGHLHPLKYTRGLARAAASAGVRIYERTAALKLQRHQGLGAQSPEVITAQGRVRSGHVLLAGGVYLQALVPRLAARVMPVGTFVAATEPLDPARAKALIPSGAAVSDTNVALDYFRVSADGRMVFGGRASYSGTAPANLKSAMRQRMVAVFPQLADVPIAHAWGGYVDITMNRAPDFGRLHDEGWPQAYYLQGFSGHGLALTGMAGVLAADAMCGRPERFDLFSAIPHRPFPGGRWLRMPTLVLGMAWYRLRDRLG